MKSLYRYACFVTVFTLFVIMWGAYVRASGSGAGCGSHWPLCNGETIPTEANHKTLVEFSHRVTSGLSLIFVVALYVLTRIKFSKSSKERRVAFYAMIFIFAEAAIGACLVLLKLVADNDSALRAIVIGLHLINTFGLVGSLAAACFFLRQPEKFIAANWKDTQSTFGFAVLGLVFVGASGGIVALGDTLFPSASLSEGIKQDFSATAHFLIRLRLWHPIVAVIVSGFLFYVSRKAATISTDPRTKKVALTLMTVVTIQVIIGFTNLALLAPIPLQLIHLAFAELTFICLMILILVTTFRPQRETAAY